MPSFFLWYNFSMHLLEQKPNVPDKVKAHTIPVGVLAAVFVVIVLALALIRSGIFAF